VAKITSRQLKIEDADTGEEEIVIKVTRIPKYGILSRLPEGTTVSQFTQSMWATLLSQYNDNGSI